VPKGEQKQDMIDRNLEDVQSSEFYCSSDDNDDESCVKYRSNKGGDVERVNKVRGDKGGGNCIENDDEIYGEAEGKDEGDRIESFSENHTVRADKEREKEEVYMYMYIHNIYIYMYIHDMHTNNKYVYIYKHTYINNIWMHNIYTYIHRERKKRKGGMVLH
jgi:hypothetical protein